MLPNEGRRGPVIDENGAIRLPGRWQLQPDSTMMPVSPARSDESPPPEAAAEQEPAVAARFYYAPGVARRPLQATQEEEAQTLQERLEALARPLPNATPAAQEEDAQATEAAAAEATAAAAAIMVNERPLEIVPDQPDPFAPHNMAPPMIVVITLPTAHGTPWNRLFPEHEFPEDGSLAVVQENRSRGRALVQMFEWRTGLPATPDAPEIARVYEQETNQTWLTPASRSPNIRPHDPKFESVRMFIQTLPSFGTHDRPLLGERERADREARAQRLQEIGPQLMQGTLVQFDPPQDAPIEDPNRPRSRRPGMIGKILPDMLHFGESPAFH